MNENGKRKVCCRHCDLCWLTVDQFPHCPNCGRPVTPGGF